MIALQTNGSRAILQPETGTLLSFRVDGREWLWCDESPDIYRNSRSLGGIPLLFPWANRLQSWHTITDSGTYEIPEEARHRIWTDGNGLPLHGSMLKRAWHPRDKRHEIRSDTQHEPRPISESDQAILRFQPDDVDRLIFPVEYRLQLEVTLRETTSAATLEVALIVENGERPLPLAVGFHPYFRLDGLCHSTDELRFELPLAAHIETDERLIPTGQLVDAEQFWPGKPRRWRALDDGFLLVNEPEHVFVLRGPLGSLRLRWGPEYPVAVLYAPGPDFICVEPMTAPTNGWHRAHVGGWKQRWLEPGEQCRLGFALEVS